MGVPFNKDRAAKACMVGNMLSSKVAEEATDVATLKTKVAALEEKLAAVLAATASDSGKKLTIDSNGKVALTT